MSISGIQGQSLEVRVVGCSRLKDTEWISRQDPYVFVEYGHTKFRTKTCTDGGKNPTFQEKFVFTLIEGLRELNIVVWNSNTLTVDGFIGSGRVQLNKVLSDGYDDTAWPIQTKTGRSAGEVRLILHYANAKKKPTAGMAPSAPLYSAPSVTNVPLYSTPPLHAYSYPPPLAGYSAPPPCPSYQSNSGSYPTYPPPPTASTYPSTYPPPSAYPSTYPPSPYPPPPQGLSCYPPAPYPGIYPPPPY